jgi:HK97 family phage major capsid protein
MASKSSNLASLVSGITTYWPGESQAITESDPVFGQPVLEAKKLAAMTHSSTELDEDSGIALAELLMQLFAEAIADEEDRVILRGSVSAGDPFNGVLFTSGVNQTTMGTGLDAFADVGFNDISSLIDSISTKASRGARYFLHRTVLGLLRQVRDLNHNYIWSPPSGGDPATIWGYPYTLSDQMPSTTDSAATTNFLAFGDPNHVFLGDRRRLTLSISDDVAFATDERYFKVTERIAVLSPAIPAAFGRLRTAA